LKIKLKNRVYKQFKLPIFLLICKNYEKFTFFGSFRTDAIFRALPDDLAKFPDKEKMRNEKSYKEFFIRIIKFLVVWAL